MERGCFVTITNVVGVQFRRAGKIYDFLPGEISLRVGDQIVVDTERGPTVARVVRIAAQNGQASETGQLKTIMRMASDRDLSDTGHFTDAQMMDIARSRVDAFKLDMRIMKAESQMGGSKITIYFSSPGRVDFRDLVKDMAGALRSRVELKQVGARDEAKLVGGLGICGREYCCSSFLRDFVPVSIKMAKNQNLALNPSKVSGGCGRLLCCLTYENDAYVDLRKRLPALKSRVRHIHDGDSGNVIKTDILNQQVVFETADGRQISAKAKDVELVDKTQTQPKDGMDSEADVWAEDIDLSLLMPDGESKAKPEGQAKGQHHSADRDRGKDRGRQGSPGHRGGQDRRQQDQSGRNMQSNQRSGDSQGKDRNRDHQQKNRNGEGQPKDRPKR